MDKQQILEIIEKMHLRKGDSLRAFVPGENVPAPTLPVVRPDEKARISGIIRIPKGSSVYGIEQDGRIVSWAAAWVPDKHGIRQITVETDRNYRGHGYAAECLKALARDINEPLLYLCEQNNTASAKTAQKAGFVEVDYQ